ATLAPRSSRPDADRADTRALPLFHPVEGLVERRHPLRRAAARPRARHPPPLSSRVPPRAVLRRLESPAGHPRLRGARVGQCPLPQRRSVRPVAPRAAAWARGTEQRRLAGGLPRSVRAPPPPPAP